MKINPITNPNIIQSYKAHSTTKKETARALGGNDEVSFSEEAISFSKIMAEMKENLKVDSPSQYTRIAELKNAIQSGTYHVDSGKVADSILGIFPGE